MRFLSWLQRLYCHLIKHLDEDAAYLQRFDMMEDIDE
jgi:hypothetical protein